MISLFRIVHARGAIPNEEESWRVILRTGMLMLAHCLQVVALLTLVASQLFRSSGNTPVSECTAPGQVQRNFPPSQQFICMRPCAVAASDVAQEATSCSQRSSYKRYKQQTAPRQPALQARGVQHLKITSLSCCKMIAFRCASAHRLRLIGLRLEQRWSTMPRILMACLT